MDFDDLDELEESGAGDILRTVAAQDVAWQSFQKRRKEEERCHQDRLEELRRRRLMEEQLQRERERERQDREYEEFLRRKQQEAELWRRQHEAWGAEGSCEEEGLQEAPCGDVVEEEAVEEEGDADEAELLRRLELEDSERLACRQGEEPQAQRRAEPPPPPPSTRRDAAAAAAAVPAAPEEEEEEGDRHGAWEAMAERQRARKERQRLKAKQAQEEPTNHEPSLHFDPYTSFCQRLMAKTRHLNDMEREYEDLRRPREPEPGPEEVEAEGDREEGQLQIEAVPVLQSVLALIDREEERDRDFQEFRHCLPDLGSGGESAAAAAEEEEELPNPYLAASVKAFEGKAHGVDLTSVMGLHFEAARKAAKLPELEADYTERLEEKQRRLQEKEREAKEAARRGLARKVEASLARDLKRPILGAAPKNAKIVASEALWQGSSAAAAGSELGSWGGKHFTQGAPAARSAGSDRAPPGPAAAAASRGHWTAGDGGWGGSSSSASAAPRLVPERPLPKGRLAALRGGGGSQAAGGRAAKPAADAGGPGAPKKPPGGPAPSAPGGPTAAGAGPPHASAAAASPAEAGPPHAEGEAGGLGAARVERRKAPDGRCYTREQFLEFYSGLAEWEAAPARAEAAATAEDLE